MSCMAEVHEVPGTSVLSPCYKKQLWLEMDSDIILNKPDLNT